MEFVDLFHTIPPSHHPLVTLATRSSSTFFTPSITPLTLSSRRQHGVSRSFSHHPSLLSSSCHPGSIEFLDSFHAIHHFHPLVMLAARSFTIFLHAISHSHHPLVTFAVQSSSTFFSPSITLFIISSRWQHGVSRLLTNHPPPSSSSRHPGSTESLDVYLLRPCILDRSLIQSMRQSGLFFRLTGVHTGLVLSYSAAQSHPTLTKFCFSLFITVPVSC